MAITIVGIPFAVAALRIAQYTLLPFGYTTSRATGGGRPETIQSIINVAGIASAVLSPLATPAATDLNVVLAIKPIHSLVAAVMGETGTPKLLVGGSAR